MKRISLANKSVHENSYTRVPNLTDWQASGNLNTKCSRKKRYNLLTTVFTLVFLSLAFNGLSIGYNADLGTLTPGSTITRSGSTAGYSNVYDRGGADYVYRVYISGATSLTVSTCGCGWDSYLHVLNASDTRLAFDDDAGNSDPGRCGYGSSIISALSITSAGYYFIVVDGYGSTSQGSYTLNISSTGSTANLTGGSVYIGTTSVSSGSSPGTITNSVSPTGGTGSYSYQWLQSTDNVNWSGIGGATSANYSVPALYSTAYFRRMVTSGTTAYSNTVVISVSPIATLTGGTISIGSTSVSSGSSPGAFTNSTYPSGGTGSYAYQWQQSTDNANWSNISGQTSATYSVPALYTNTYFRRMVTSGTTAYSNTVQVSVTVPSGSVTSVNGYTGTVTLGLSSSSSGTQRTIGITNGTGTTIDVADNDNSATNEIQSLSVSGSTLSISSGNSVTLPSATYPGAGIPVSTGSGWTTSIANNSANWNTAYNWGNHAGLYRPISYVPAWNTISSKPTTIAGYGITDAMTTSHAANAITVTTIAAWNAKQGALTITTAGSSGAATLVGNTLNIPQYSGSGGGSSQWTPSGSNIYYTTGGVSIATTSLPSGYKLAVGGKIIAEEVMVKTVNTWPDYVFGKDYPLKPLSEVGEFIQTNGHLPEVPSAQEVKENGIGLSEMDRVLLKKVEEMTLYILELEKRVKELEQK